MPGSNLPGMTMYVLLDPRDYSIRYVGETRISLSNRLSSHMHDPRDNARTRWIRELTVRGNRPIIQPIHGTDGETEEYWISWFRDAGCDLVNTLGGGPHHVQPRELVERRVAAIAAKRADGTFKRRPRETKSACRNGHEWTEENTYRNGKGQRICRTCNRERQRARFDWKPKP